MILIAEAWRLSSISLPSTINSQQSPHGQWQKHIQTSGKQCSNNYLIIKLKSRGRECLYFVLDAATWLIQLNHVCLKHTSFWKIPDRSYSVLRCDATAVSLSCPVWASRGQQPRLLVKLRQWFVSVALNGSDLLHFTHSIALILLTRSHQCTVAVFGYSHKGQYVLNYWTNCQFIFGSSEKCPFHISCLVQPTDQNNINKKNIQFVVV